MRSIWTLRAFTKLTAGVAGVWFLTALPSRATNSLNSYTGELRIVCANDDRVVYPSEVSWFYFQALRVKSRKFVRLDNCDHEFSGNLNKEIILKSPLWAFDNLVDFPANEEISEEIVYETFSKPEEGYN